MGKSVLYETFGAEYQIQTGTKCLEDTYAIITPILHITVVVYIYEKPST